MPQSIYAALTGKEIRDIIKNKVLTEIDKIPYLKMGASFHRAELDFGFTMKAFPATVPVPEKEFTIVADSGTVNSEEAIKQIQQAEEVDRQLNKIREQISKFEETLSAGETYLASIRQDHEAMFHVDGSVPDQTRIENDLPVPVRETKGGKTVQTTLPASFFKKEPVSQESAK